MSQAPTAHLARRRGGDRLERVGSEPDPRATFANERTFLAWNRTALALVATGLAVDQFLEIGTAQTRLLLALPPILLGAAISFSSYGRWRANERNLRLGAPLGYGPFPRYVALAFGLIAIAAAAFATLHGVR